MSDDWQHVKCLDFVRYEGDTLVEICCKLCGSSIAGMTEQVVKRGTDRNGTNVVTVRQRFQRHHNYGEIKIQFTNGSWHVTTCCSKCGSESLTPEALQEMYWADVSREPTAYTANDRKRTAEKVVSVLRGSGGLM